MKLVYGLLALFLLFSYVSPTWAVAEDQEVDMTSLPKQLTEALGLPDAGDYFAGKLLTTAIILSLFMLPTVFACNRFEKDALIPSIFTGLIGFGFCIAMDWLDYWFLLVASLIIALMFATRMRDLVGGRG